MRIEQCHVSKSVHDFPFTRLYNLRSYFDSIRPCIFFGCYDEEDLRAILAHRALVVIWWCGQDALDFKEWHLFGKNVVHVTERLKVHEHISKLGIPVKLNPCSNLAEPAPITPLGNKIFAYMPASYPEYHGKAVIDHLRSWLTHDLIIGDGSINQNDWRAGACNPIYDQCFIGLVLSHFAGGGASVIELGLRGRKCVTNVVKLGNVIHWNKPEDVWKAVVKEADNIGKTKVNVVIDTMKSIDYTNEFLNLDQYEK